jgi:RES domain-containing protein
MPDGKATSQLTLWRAFVPRWAHLPLSGDGVARFGGRWNPVGVPAIYAACELSTAWAEYNQGLVQHPALIVQLRLIGAKLADLTSAQVLDQLKISADIHRCEWRAMMDQGKVPETHSLLERLLAGGFHGVMYPSFMSRGGICVALWRWNSAGSPRLEVVDADHRLPRTPASWM